MKPIKIVSAPHPSLRQPANPVERVDKKLIDLVKSLGITLQNATNPPGVGLASPQVDTHWRIFVTNLETSQSDEPILRAFINPHIIDQSDRQVLGIHPREPDMEGCLSIPSLYGPVLRPEWVNLEFQVLTAGGELSAPRNETFFDFAARVTLHELDHLDGILFTDRIIEQGQSLFQQDINNKLVEVDPQIARGL